MNPTSPPKERIHGLDALRGILMILGIVLHVEIAYFPPDWGGGWAVQDPRAHTYFAGFSMTGIHFFRMPAFFFISGFFGALLWQKRGAKSLIENRFKRIAIPLVVFLLLLWPLVLFSDGYAQTLASMRPSAFQGGLQEAAGGGFFPHDTMHLWFLWYLLIVTGLTILFVIVWNRLGLGVEAIHRATRSILESPTKTLLILGGLVFTWNLISSWAQVATSTAWEPNPEKLAFYWGWYGLGWLMFRSDTDLLSMQKGAWTLFFIGIACTIANPIYQEAHFEIAAASCAVGMVAFTRSFMGLFMRYANHGSKAMRYISDSSYWVYLLHLPLSLLMPALLLKWDISVWIKMPTAIALVSIGCWATYDAFVRNSFVGRMLNGRTYAPAAWGFSFTTSIVFIGGLLYALVHVQMDPWLNGSKPPSEILGQKVQYPVAPSNPDKHNPFTHCAESQGVIYCIQPTPVASLKEACAIFSAKPIVLNESKKRKRIQAIAKALNPMPYGISVNDRKQEGEWVWSDGTPLNIETWPWNPGEPNNWGGEEHCATMNWGPGWNDIGCDFSTGFICERSSTP